MTCRAVQTSYEYRYSITTAVEGWYPTATLSRRFSRSSMHYAAVRLVCGLRPRDSVTSAMTQLYWLQIEARIQYKLCLLVHLALAGKAPAYITNLLQLSATLPARQTILRSATNNDLFLMRTRLKFGEHACSVAVPKAWNKLPLDVRTVTNTDTFKTKLKTFFISDCKLILVTVNCTFYSASA